jgi:hypothetical protein
MSQRPNESFLPSSRGSGTCPRFIVGGKMCDKNLEKQINIKFCVKIGKSATETSALLTVAYGEYAMKKSEWTSGSRKGKMCKMTQDVGNQTQRTHANVDRV